tara:strand:+ start:299 stop:616 length:318 start_codon:yes stop_codon:yes gene_type:complete
MEPFDKLKDRLNDALEQIETSLESKLENKGALEALISENSDLKRQIDLLTVQLENLNKDKEENSNFEDLSTEIANLKAEREEEKKELQTLYDQLSSALAVSVEEV